ncbi:hypothetical protein L4D09_12705 [Photobacterium makurazakiensis]|uniref:hypothetical protein n=1 Tax=Photobacterium makurazakiensis TaxID=2910234 RepID=UPI003D12BD08
MKNIIPTIILTAMFIPSLVSAQIRVADTHNGVWVSVYENNEPVSNVSVTIANVPQVKESYITNSKGKVFIPMTLESSRSLKYKATTANGNTYSRYAFHSTNK